MIGVAIHAGLISFFNNKRILALQARLGKSAAEHQDLRMKMWKLSRYVSPQIWRTIFSGREVKLETLRLETLQLLGLGLEQKILQQ